MNDTILFESECMYTKELNYEFINFNINIYNKNQYRKTRIMFTIMMFIGVYLFVVCVNEFTFLRFFLFCLFFFLGLTMIFLSTSSPLLCKLKSRNFKEVKAHLQFHEEYLMYCTKDIERKLDYRNFIAVYEGTDFYFLEESSHIFIFLPKIVSSQQQASYTSFIQDTVLRHLPSIEKNSCSQK